jgi:hypothetical protein
MSSWTLARALAVTACVSSLAGCFPMRLTERPAVVGKIVDAHSGVSVESVRIAFKPFDDHVEAASTAATAGEFMIPRTTMWGIGAAQMDFMQLRAILEIVAPGFQTLQRRVAWTAGGPSHIDLGLIRMVREGSGDTLRSEALLRSADAYELIVDAAGQCSVNQMPVYCPEVGIELRKLHPEGDPAITVCSTRNSPRIPATQLFQALQAESLYHQYSKVCGP